MFSHVFLTSFVYIISIIIIIIFFFRFPFFYLSCATITTLHYTAKPTYRNWTYIAVILLN